MPSPTLGQGAGVSPTIAYGAGAGTSPPGTPVVSGTDTAGTVSFGTGTTPTTGACVTVTFGGVHSGTPRVLVTAQNVATATNSAAAQQWYATATATSFSIGGFPAPTASQPNGTYVLAYEVIDQQ